MPNKTHLKFINVYGDSSPSFSTIINGLPSLNVTVTVPALKMMPVKDVQKMHNHQKSLKCTIWYWMTGG
jgi:hypothetical protein